MLPYFFKLIQDLKGYYSNIPMMIMKFKKIWLGSKSSSRKSISSVAATEGNPKDVGKVHHMPMTFSKFQNSKKNSNPPLTDRKAKGTSPIITPRTSNPKMKMKSYMGPLNTSWKKKTTKWNYYNKKYKTRAMLRPSAQEIAKWRMNNPWSKSYWMACNSQSHT